MARKKAFSKRKGVNVLRKIPNIRVDIEGKKASLTKSKGRATAKFGKYVGTVKQGKTGLSINLKKKRTNFFEDIFG